MVFLRVNVNIFSVLIIIITFLKHSKYEYSLEVSTIGTSHLPTKYTLFDSGYTLVRSVTIIRHATRLPTEDTILEMKQILPELQWMLKLAAGAKTKRASNAKYNC